MTAQWWQPSNRTEQAMADALRHRDSAEYLRLVAASDLYQPLVADQAPFTMQVQGETLIAVFTSIEGMRTLVGAAATAHTTTSFEQLRAGWPDPRWRLAVNPGLPVAANLSVADEPVLTFDPDGLRMLAIAQEPVDARLEALLDATVSVATTRPVDYPDDLVGPEFPIRVAETSDTRAVEVFSGPEARTQAYPQAPGVELPLILLLAIMPDRLALSVDPGRPDRLWLPVERVLLLKLRALQRYNRR